MSESQAETLAASIDVILEAIVTPDPTHYGADIRNKGRAELQALVARLEAAEAERDWLKMNDEMGKEIRAEWAEQARKLATKDGCQCDVCAITTGLEAAEAERDRLADALKRVNHELLKAQAETTHGKTANSAYIDQCVDSAARVTKAALAALAAPEEQLDA